MVLVYKQSLMEHSPVLPPHPAHSQTREDEFELRAFDAHEWNVDVVVTAVIPELEMVVARAENEDLEVHLVDMLPGVQWNEISIGQRRLVKLIGVLAPLVVSAEVAQS